MSYNNQIQRILDQADQLKFESRYSEAIKLCEKVLVININCVEAYEEIGDNYISLRELSKAEKALRRALALDLESANANYLLGFLYSCRRAWKRSIEFLEKADGLKSNHPEVLRCLGWSLFCSGACKRGVILLERARALAPNDVYVLTDLGVCYLNEKNIEAALDIFHKILKLDPDNRKARECLLVAEEYAAGTKRLKRK